MKTDIYDAKGKKAGTIDLPEAVFNTPWNGDLVHQVVTSMRSNTRLSTAQTKDRSEVSGTGKKPWRQKGTGNARHGSRRSPIWRTGGIAHGPTNQKDYSKKVNKKMKIKALYALLSQKMRDGQILFVSPVEMKEIKTKTAHESLLNLAKLEGFETINTPKRNNIMITIPEGDETVEKSFRNLSHVTIQNVHNLNPLDVAAYRYLIISAPEVSVDFLASKMSK